MNFPSKFTLLLNTSSSNQDVTIQIFLCASKFSFCDFLLTNSVENKSQRLSSSTANSSHNFQEKLNSLNHVPNLPIPMCPCSLEHLRHRRANGGRDCFCKQSGGRDCFCKQPVTKSLRKRLCLQICFSSLQQSLQWSFSSLQWSFSSVTPSKNKKSSFWRVF